MPGTYSGHLFWGERRAVVRHLLQGCTTCSRRLSRYLPAEQAELPADAYDQAFERSLERVLEAVAAAPVVG